MFKIYVFLMSLWSFFSCSHFSSPPPKSEKIALADKVSRACAQTLSNRHGLVQIGEGGQMMDEIKGIYLGFSIHRTLSKDEARAILIDCAHEVITAVNNDSKIQKYLLPGGFNEKSVQITILIDSNFERTYYPELSACSYNFGRLCFHTNDPDNFYRYKTREIETYEEAIALLEAQSAH